MSNTKTRHISQKLYRSTLSFPLITLLLLALAVPGQANRAATLPTVSIEVIDSLGFHQLAQGDSLFGSITGGVLLPGDQFLVSGENGFLAVLDISDPAEPVEVSRRRICDEVIRDLREVNESLLAAITYTSLLLVDITNPILPEIVLEQGSFDFDGPHAFSATENRVYTIESQHEFAAWSVQTDPDVALTLLGTVSPGTFSSMTDAYALDLEGDTAYVASADYLVQVYDLSADTAPVLLGELEREYMLFPPAMVSLSARDGYVYSGHYANQNSGIEVCDCRDETNPQWIVHCELPDGAFIPRDILVQDDRMNVTSSHNTAISYSLSNPANPTFLHETYWPGPGQVSRLVDSGTYTLGYGSHGFVVAGMTGDSTEVVGELRMPDVFWELAMTDELLYASTSSGQLLMYDISDPDQPILVDKQDHELPLRQIVYNDLWLVVMTLDDDLYLFDRSDPAHPVLLDQLYVETYAYDMVMDGEIIYLSTFPQFTTEVIQIDDDGELSVLATIAGRADGLSGEGDLLATAGVNYGLGLYDISDPAHPAQLGFLAEPDLADVVLDGEYAWINRSGGYQLLDISDPGDIQRVALHSLDWTPTEVRRIDATHLQLSDDEQFHIYDVSDPLHPVETGYIQYQWPDDLALIAPSATHDGLMAIALEHELWLYDIGSTLPVAEDSDRFQQTSLPHDFGIVSTHPNPFNATLQFTVSLPTAAELQVSVVDLLGRSVARPVPAAWFSAGRHTLSWNAEDHASGVYFLRLEAGGQSATRRITLLR